MEIDGGTIRTGHTDMRVWFKQYGLAVVYAALAATGFTVEDLIDINESRDVERTTEVLGPIASWVHTHPDPDVPDELRFAAFHFGMVRLSLPLESDEEVARQARLRFGELMAAMPTLH
jgi:hypothetical protein